MNLDAVAAPRSRPARRPRARGWVPNQHGAWAMLLTPLVLGALVSGPAWRHALLLVAWLLAYFAFFATGQWLRAGRKTRWWPPVRTYGLATALLGGALLATAPALLGWAPVYAPLLVISLVASARRADRSWLNDAVTVLAASLMAPVAAGLGQAGTAGLGQAGTAGLATVADLGRLPVTAFWPPPGLEQPAALGVGLICFGYFFGTVFYVKTMIRDRGSRTVLAASVTYHLLLTVAAAAAHPALGVVAALLALRAAVVPRRWPGATPRAIGFGEVAATVVVAAVTLAVV